jgi:hypothetical protein
MATKEKATSRDLFEIGDDLVALESLLYEVGGDISDDDAAAAVDEWLTENHAALEAKLDGYGYLVKKFEEKAAFARAEAKRLSERAQARENAAKRMKERLKVFMEIHGQKKLETPRYDFAVQANGGKAPVEVTVPVEDLPPWAQVVTVVPNTEAIREAFTMFDDPDRVEAVQRIARLGERGTHLRIR